MVENLAQWQNFVPFQDDSASVDVVDDGLAVGAREMPILHYYLHSLDQCRPRNDESMKKYSIFL